jgi:hypothetical protein
VNRAAVIEQVKQTQDEGNKAIEGKVISSYQIAQSPGFNDDHRAWEHLLRIRE